MNLPYLHVRHLALLDALVAVNQGVHQVSVEEGCGIDQASNAIASLIYKGEPYLVLTADQRNVIPNPKLFELLRDDDLLPGPADSYRLLVRTALARMQEIYPGNLVQV